MPVHRIDKLMREHVVSLEKRAISKGKELVVSAMVEPAQDRGPRVTLEGYGTRQFLRFNSNSYLGLSRDPRLVAAEERAVREFGVGPGAVRFISGTCRPHVALEQRLAEFFRRESALIFSSAYATVVSVLAALVTPDTSVISDELNHNCIINAIKLTRPKTKQVYRHNKMAELEEQIKLGRGGANRVIVITDGVFSMRGDFAPLDVVGRLVDHADDDYPENAVLVVDDSHGVFCFGDTGRGTEEQSSARPVDVLIGTLGKALGVNGGFVVGSDALIRYLRETAPMYIYSNPITMGEAAAALEALDIVDSAEGKARISDLRKLTARFESGLVSLGFEVIPGPHPVVPLMVRDTAKTQQLVKHLFQANILATGLFFPVVPRGDEEIRFQINASHTIADIDFVLSALASANIELVKKS